MAAPFVGLDQYLIGDDVELFLHFALYVFALRAAHHLAQGTLVDGLADAFAGARHHFKQQAQLRWDVAFQALLFHQVTCQGNSFRHVLLLVIAIHSASARLTTSRTSLLRSALAATRLRASQAACW